MNSAPALNAAMQVASHAAVRTDPVNVTMLYVATTATVTFAPALALPWRFELDAPGGRGWLGPSATYLSLIALQRAEVAALAPWDYSGLLISSVAALVIFHEVPSGWAWCGMAAIVADCLMQMTHR